MNIYVYIYIYISNILYIYIYIIIFAVIKDNSAGVMVSKLD